MVWPERRWWPCDTGEGDVESDIVAMDVDRIGDPPMLKYHLIQGLITIIQKHKNLIFEISLKIFVLR